MSSSFSRAAGCGFIMPLLLSCSPAPGAPPVSFAGYAASTVDGKPATVASLRGQAVLLNVWATWCGPCRQEIPFLAGVQKSEAANGLRVIGISIDAAQDRDKVIASAADLGLTYEVWLDPEEAIGDWLKTTGMPVSALIDRQGIMRWSYTGVLRDATPGFREALAGILATPQER